ncbi:hypothetical protein CAT59_07345 [Acinetobacter pittii]|uniref:Uncharacterized protein n=1 Tax=Acinetobacter pittii TaxID=48296 RepID=A0A242U5R9_ACIPI|nr:hypothetical protein [Acinetobacter pittii]OTU28366.1 hypothetical protein CAT59_07345 [Acinetobacter pittii]
MASKVFLIAYVTEDNEIKSATIVPQSRFEKFGIKALNSFKEQVQLKTGDKISYILSFNDLGYFQENEIEEFEY